MKNLEKEYNTFIKCMIPFGSLDIKTALETALEVEENSEWVAKIVNDFMEETNIAMEDVDVVYCVYDAILQEVRNEIDDLIGFDFANDDAEIYTYGNYMSTSYDWSEDAPQKIVDRLTTNKIVFSNLTVKTQWFLKSIEVNY